MRINKQKYGQYPLSEGEIKRLNRTVNYRVDNKMRSELQKRNDALEYASKNIVSRYSSGF